MLNPAYLPFLFMAISLIFFAVTFRDYSRSKGAPNPARKTWLRVAVVFAVVGIGLLAMRVFLK